MVDNSVPLRPATANLSPQQILNKTMVNAHVIKFTVDLRPLLDAELHQYCEYQSENRMNRMYNVFSSYYSMYLASLALF